MLGIKVIVFEHTVFYTVFEKSSDIIPDCFLLLKLISIKLYNVLLKLLFSFCKFFYCFCCYRTVLLRTAMIAIIVYFWAISNVPDEGNRPVSCILLTYVLSKVIFLQK